MNRLEKVYEAKVGWGLALIRLINTCFRFQMDLSVCKRLQMDYLYLYPVVICKA